MKISKKALALTMSAAVLTSIAAGGTLAYLTSQDTSVNTFTIGKVKIDLKESEVGEDGKILPGGGKVDNNEYSKILPGATIDKDPQVTVEEGSASCYVYMAVFSGLGYDDADGTIVQFAEGEYDDDAWEWVTAVYPWEAPEITIYRYVGSSAEDGIVTVGDEDVVLETLFEGGKMEISKDLDAGKWGKIYADKILVKAFAVQADGLEGGQDTADQMAEDYLGELSNWTF